MALEMIPAQEVRVGDTIHLFGQARTVTEVFVGRSSTAIRSTYTEGDRSHETVTVKSSDVEVAVDRAPTPVPDTVPENWTANRQQD